MTVEKKFTAFLVLLYFRSFLSCRATQNIKQLNNIYSTILN